MKSTRAKQLAGAAALLAALAYPFAIVAGLHASSPRAIGAVLAMATLAAVWLTSDRTAVVLPLVLKRFGLLLVVAMAAAATDNPLALTLLPSLTNLWLLATFAASLREELSLVEQFASASHKRFPDFLLPYCRKVTLAWCGFFAINALVSAVLAVTGPPRLWALYTGALSYVLVAGLGLAEYAFHKARFRFYEDGWIDGLWRRLLPPERTELGRRTLQWQLAQNTDAKAPL